MVILVNPKYEWIFSRYFLLKFLSDLVGLAPSLDVCVTSLCKIFNLIGVLSRNEAVLKIDRIATDNVLIE